MIKHTFLIEAVSDHDKHIQRRSQDAVHPSTDVVVHNLALEARHGRKVHADTALNDAKQQKHETLVVQVNNNAQAARYQHDGAEENIRVAGVVAAQAAKDSRAREHGAHEAGEDEAKGQLTGDGAAGGKVAGVLQRRGPEEDEEVHGAFEDAGGEAEGENLGVAEEIEAAGAGVGCALLLQRRRAVIFTLHSCQ